MRIAKRISFSRYGCNGADPTINPILIFYACSLIFPRSSGSAVLLLPESAEGSQDFLGIFREFSHVTPGRFACGCWRGDLRGPPPARGFFNTMASRSSALHLPSPNRESLRPFRSNVGERKPSRANSGERTSLRPATVWQARLRCWRWRLRHRELF